MAIRMQQRRGTAEQWTLANPILAEGEIGFEIDINQFKVGDGVNRWEDLSYFRNSNDVDEILEDFIPLSEKGESNGVATLDEEGQVPADQLANATVDLSDYATEEYVDTAVTNLVASAPETLDTLNELAAALGDDANFATTVTNSIATKAPIESPTFTGTVSGVTKTHVGLGNVDNTSDADKPVSTTQQTALNLKANLESPTFTGTVAGVTKTHVGLGNVDNTSDANKPVSTATQTALNGKANTSHTHNQSELITTVSDKSAGYTILATDKNSIIRSTDSAITITIANVLAIGERIDFVQSGAGQITFAASGVTLQSRDSKLKTAGQHAGATVMCIASGVYVIVGDLAA
jgi:hypothetical protein